MKKQHTQHIQYVALWGYYGASVNLEVQKRMNDANKLIDKYNKNVYSYETMKEQVNYQRKMSKKLKKLLKVKNK
jgi:hypothetical protein